MSNTTETPLYGQAEDQALADAGGYKSPDEYADQGDTRVVRDLQFAYLVEVQDPAGNKSLEPRDVPRDTELNVNQIGLVALMKGERNHSFYTTAELARVNQTGSPAEPVAAEANLSELGEFELAEWLATNNPETGRVWTINDVLERVGTDKDLAQRMLQAEHIRGDNDPRDGLVAGLNKIIEDSNQ